MNFLILNKHLFTFNNKIDDKIYIKNLKRDIVALSFYLFTFLQMMMILFYSNCHNKSEDKKIHKIFEMSYSSTFHSKIRPFFYFLTNDVNTFLFKLAHQGC